MRPANILHLGIKELRSLSRDRIMIILIVYTFSLGIYAAATAKPETLNKAPIAIVDEDRSPLSARLISAFYPPHFLAPALIQHAGMDEGMDAGRFTFAVNIPPDLQRDVLAGRAPAIQLNVDATRMSQAFVGSGYVQSIITDEVGEFVRRYRETPVAPVDLALRARFNPSLDPSWFGSVMQVINNVTLLSIVLTGAALLRERERGTIEHLLAMPVTPFEIMSSKVWAMGLVVLSACAASLAFVVQGLLAVPIGGSIPLFLGGTALHLFATASLGIFMGTAARSMPQFGILVILVVLPLQMLSGASTPRESMPEFVQQIMWAAPTTHFVSLSQAILYRGAGFEIVWREFIALGFIGIIFFTISLALFRKAINTMA